MNAPIFTNITKATTDITPEYKAYIDALYDEAMQEVFGKNGHGRETAWDENEVKTRMEWFRDTILQEPAMEILLATSPLHAQRVAHEYTGESIFFSALNYPWFSDRRFVKRYKFGKSVIVDGYPLYKGLEEDVQKLDEYEAFLNTGIFHVLAARNDKTKKEALIVAPLFSWVDTDADGRLHSLTGPAIAWRDGYKEYAIIGIFFDEAAWDRIVKKEMTVEEIYALKNTDERAAVLSVYGTEWVIEHLGAKIIDSISLDGKAKEGKFYTFTNADEYVLYKVPAKVFGREEYFLRYADPSTGRKYFENVPPEEGVKGALSSIAWKFGTDEESFKHMEYHA